MTGYLDLRLWLSCRLIYQAAEAGLKKDDLIVAVDGGAASGVSLSDLRARLRNDPPGTVVTFSVKRGGAVQDIKLTLRDLI